MKNLDKYQEIELPELNEVEAHCVCGAKFKLYTTKKELRVDICSQCHPFFTGKKRIVDTEGRIERFNKKYADAQKK